MAIPDASRLTRWRGLATAGLVASLLSAASCNGAVSEDAVQRNEELAQELAAELDSTGDYTEVRAGYNDDTDNRKSLFVQIRCEACRPSQAVEAALQLAWESRISPVRTISVSVTDVTAPRKASRDVRTYQEDDVAEMIRKYGERPVESLPEDD